MKERELQQCSSLFFYPTAHFDTTFPFILCPRHTLSPCNDIPVPSRTSCFETRSNALLLPLRYVREIRGRFKTSPVPELRPSSAMRQRVPATTACMNVSPARGKRIAGVLRTQIGSRKRRSGVSLSCPTIRAAKVRLRDCGA